MILEGIQKNVIIEKQKKERFITKSQQTHTMDLIFLF